MSITSIDPHVATARGHGCVNPDAARHRDAGHYKKLVLGVGADDEEGESHRGSTHLLNEAA